MPLVHAFSMGSRGVVALPGYFIADTPWAGQIAFAGTIAGQTQGSAMLSGGLNFNNSNTQNDEFGVNHWLATGTYKVALIYRNQANEGIDSVRIGGSTVATLDMYNAGGAYNNYTEVTTSYASTAGVKQVSHLAATKNASSSGYLLEIHTTAWVRTGA